MNWHGKAFGALIGVLAGGPAGALAGAFIGHLFDANSKASDAPRVSDAGSAAVQEAFFNATFQVMGRIAKADGRVSEADIRAARAMMSELNLSEREVQRAIQLFTEGKDEGFPLETALGSLRDLCTDRPDLHRMFVQIQLQAALWSGELPASARKVFSKVCSILDVSPFELVRIEALLRMQAAAPTDSQRSGVDRLSDAYSVLGIAHTAADGEVTKAYRRLMNQNHPDKLVAKGLPESMMKVAEEKTRRIRAAYELIRTARGLK